MADNWLESRAQQLSGGKITYRKNNPSLDSLLHKLASRGGETFSAGASSGDADCIKMAQLQAIARSVNILFPDLELVCDETDGSISWVKDFQDSERAGAVILVMRLKAGELGFSARRDGTRVVFDRMK